MDLNDNSNWVGLEESDEDEYLSDFENNDEENIDDDYFKKYVDVGVEDVLDEVVRSSQLMMVGHNETEQRNMVEVRKENDLGMLYDYESEEIEEVDVEGLKHIKYNPLEMCKGFKFTLGMDFTSTEQFRNAAREYALLNGYEVKFAKNDKVRCRVIGQRSSRVSELGS